MARYKALIQVSNIEVPFDDNESAIGFYTTVFINASNETLASELAIKKLTTSNKYKSLLSSNCSPQIAIDSIDQVPFYTNLFNNQLGYAFYGSN